MKKLYLFPSDKPGCHFLSPFPIEHEEWESNHTEIDLLPRIRNDIVSCGVEVNILSNILFAAGVLLINEG